MKEDSAAFRLKRGDDERVAESLAGEKPTGFPQDLPDSYGQTRVILMPVAPHLVFAHWEVASDELERARDSLGGDHVEVQALLRFHDVTETSFERGNSNNFFDFSIDLQSKKQYVPLWSPDKSYFVELGLKSGKGEFFPLARSNITHVPPARVSPIYYERYMLVFGYPETLETSPIQRYVQPLYSGIQPASPDLEAGPDPRSDSDPEEDTSVAEIHDEQRSDDPERTSEPLPGAETLSEEITDRWSPVSNEEGVSGAQVYEGVPADEQINKIGKKDETEVMKGTGDPVEIMYELEESLKGGAPPDGEVAARSIDLERIAREPLDEGGKEPMRANVPVLQPEQRVAQHIDLQSRQKGTVDLTELSERIFRLGMSSKHTRSCHHKDISISLAAKILLGDR